MRYKKMIFILSIIFAITLVACSSKDNSNDPKDKIQEEEGNEQEPDQVIEEDNQDNDQTANDEEDNKDLITEDEDIIDEAELEISLLPNAGFEQTDLMNWTARGSEKLALTDAEAYSGDYSLMITERSTTWEGPSIDLTNILEKGKRYFFSLQLKYTEGPLSKTFNLQFQNMIGGQPSYPNIGQANAIKNNWTTLEGEYAIPDSEDLTEYRLYVEVPWKPDSDVTDDDTLDFYIDHIIIYEVAPLSFQKDIPPLKDVFASYFPFGVATSTHFLNEKEIFSDFLSYHYAVLVAGNAMKPDAIQPTEGVFNWQEADQYVKFAQENDMLLRWHTLLWHSQVPDWFFTDPTDSSKPATSEMLIERLETHIKTIMGRYKGKFYSYDVVNEVISDTSGLRGEGGNSKWKSIIGDVDGDGFDSDYIELAFKYAREADPDAKLIINDYGLESRGRKRTDMYDLIKSMLEKGVPVDGVGLQMHISTSGPSPSEIEEGIELFATLKEINPDFTVEVTEMDMSVYRWMEQKKEITDQMLEEQARKYKEVFDVFRRQAEKGNLSMVVMWGMGDNDSWLENFPITGRGDAGLLFDKKLQAKPAYWAIINQDQ